MSIIRCRLSVVVRALIFAFVGIFVLVFQIFAAPGDSPASPSEYEISPLFLSDKQSQIAGLIGLLLTIGALGLALWQTRMAVTQNNSAQEQASRLNVIADALSTKYIGPYPDYVDVIPKVLERASLNIRILCSVPMHGIFNNAEGWLKTKQALETFIVGNHGNRCVRCVFSKKEERERLQRNQYKEFERSWPEWINLPDNRKKVELFSRRIATNAVDEVKTFEGFISLLEVVSDRELKTTFQGADVVEIDHSPPIFLWIVDDREAIFVLKTTHPKFKAEAFWTSDARLVASLIEIHDSYMLIEVG